MKKLIALLSAVVVLVLLGWFAMRAMNSKGHSTTELIDFALADTTTIDKIIITRLPLEPEDEVGGDE